ncbi:MAG: hypothetical protein LBQ66_08945 [Planctomycetaceae bacterium]|nr:hypothetical protein [Planctomycetaceae bacterium]
MRFGDPVVGLRRRNRLAVGCPPYDHLCDITRRDARVPVRAAARQLSAAPTSDGLEYQHNFRTISSRASHRR